MFKSNFKKTVVRWGRAGAVTFPQDYIGKEVWVLTDRDLEEIVKLREALR